MASQETLELLLKAIHDNVDDDMYWWILKDFRKSLPDSTLMSFLEFLKSEIKKYDPNVERKKKRKDKKDERPD